ncbi:MAG: GbsR/MarR family transcriptional regulator [Opitutales bacterium]
MEPILESARDRFIGQWGAMGTAWGINRTMAQIHALLLSTQEALTTDAVMGALRISRGNANTNLRELVSWGLVRSFYRKGDRKEYFEAERDVWQMFGIIARERRRREVEPALKTLEACISSTVDSASEEGQAFHSTLSDLQSFLRMGDLFLEKASRARESALVPKLMEWLK